MPPPPLPGSLTQQQQTAQGGPPLPQRHPRAIYKPAYAPGLYGMSPLSGPMRVCTVLSSAQPLKAVCTIQVQRNEAEVLAGSTMVQVEGGHVRLHGIRCVSVGGLARGCPHC